VYTLTQMNLRCFGYKDIEEVCLCARARIASLPMGCSARRMNQALRSLESGAKKNGQICV
jgi:hypothetical protein